ncbi:MAG TPA: lactate utilization protein [Gammaproteobacteria bacterium]|nr:lactate utilization protein [Gammaproteobacteria bacterium]
MSGDREKILGALGSALGRNRPAAAAASEMNARLEARPSGPRPALGPDLMHHFTDQLTAAAATWTEVRRARDTVAAIADYLRERDGSAALVASDEPILRSLPWPAELTPRFEMPAGDTGCGVVVADLGIAETGSVVLCASPAQPTRLNLLPDALICLLGTDTLVPHLEDAWERLRAHGLPRTVNLITGPSRTADVEQTLQLGAHGARHLHVVLVNEPLRP